jgi:cytochrome c5
MAVVQSAAVKRAVVIVSLFALASTLLPAQALPDGPGKDEFQKICSSCHGLDLSTDQKKTRDDWAATVDKMIGYGMDATKKEIAAVIDYLATNFAPDQKAQWMNCRPAHPILIQGICAPARTENSESLAALRMTISH